MSFIVERRENAPLNGELLRQRLVGGARKKRAAQQFAGASRRLAVWLRQPATGACSAQLAVRPTAWRSGERAGD